MTLEEIKQYFGQNQTYQFNGTESQLHDLMLSLNANYHTLVVRDVVYFTTAIDISNENVTAL